MTLLRLLHLSADLKVQIAHPPSKNERARPAHILLLIPQFCPHRPGTVPGGTVLAELAIYWLNAAENSCSARI